MKIRNDYVKIKLKDREISLNNMIFDKYLEYFFQRQYDEEKLIEYDTSIQMIYCFIKFDELGKEITESNLDNNGNQIITTNDFDIAIPINSTLKVGNESSTSTIYDYSARRGISNVKTGITTFDFNEYVGKKISALGFGWNEIFACIDTTNYSIYIESEGLNISRKDTFSSDAICIGYDYPVHLATSGDVYSYEDGKGETSSSEYAQLYSIGLGKTMGVIDEEYIVGEDIKIIKEDDKSFGFNLETGVDDGVYLSNSLYCSDELYPMPFNIKTEIYPEKDLYCNDEIYPSDSNYKYIIYKYKMCYLTRGSSVEGLEKYYTMNFEFNAKGLFEIITKIERA